MKYLVFIFVATLLVACSENSGALDVTEQEQSPGYESSKAPDQDKQSYACYQKFEKSSKCYPRFRKSEMDHTRHEYSYRDPDTDPSFPPGLNKSQYQPPYYFLDLRTVPPYTRLTPHFQTVELMAERKGRYGLYSMTALHNIERMRQDLNRPIYINSGYRSPAYNDGLAGSATWSRHTYGDAIDFYSPGTSLRQLARLCVDHGAGFYQVYSTHVHCDWRNSRPDSNFFQSAGLEPHHADHHHQDLDEIVKALENVGKVQLALIQKDDPLLSLTVDAYQEDPGQLLTEWKAILPDGTRVSSSSPVLQLPRQSGTYKVEVQVGGNVTIKKIFSL